MSQSKFYAPPRTWPIFKRNMLLTLTWPYVVSYIIAMGAPSAAMIHAPDQWFLLTRAQNEKSVEPVFRLLFFFVPILVPAPAAWWTYRKLKRAGCRRMTAWEDLGNMLYFLLISPFLCAMNGWITRRVPEWVPVVALLWGVAAVHLGDMWLFLRCPEDLEPTFYRQMIEAENEEKRRKGEEVPTPGEEVRRQPLEWNVFKHHLAEAMTGPYELLLVGLMVIVTILSSLILGEYYKSSYGYLADGPWATIAVVLLKIIPGYILGFRVSGKMKASLKAARYQTRQRDLQTVAWILQSLVSTPLAKLLLAPNRTDAEFLFWLTKFGLEIGSIWLEGYYLLDASRETQPSDKDSTDE